MANAVAITLTDFVANGEVANPTADVLDTGTAAVTLPLATGGRTNRIVIQVTNTAVANLVVSVLAGDHPPAELAGLGALATANIAQNAVVWLGPFESSRFGQNDGSLSVLFTPASGTIACNARAFRLPRI